MDPLILHLKYEYYEMIRNGEKNIEYREYKTYWKKRIKNQKEVIFVPGYGLCNSLDIKADIENISVIPFNELPQHAKLHFVNSKYEHFFAIKFK